MPTPQLVEFLRSHRATSLSSLHSLCMPFMALAVTGCLSPDGGENTTPVVLTSGSDTAGSISISISASDTTHDGIMTTTEAPETSVGPDSDASAGSDSSTGDAPPANCGDGVVQADEQCDEGEANADDGACTTQCQPAKCGDKLLQAGVELCDDGINNGEYGSCAADCSDLAAHCGDKILDAVEACDDDAPESGCLPDCTVAQSCKQIRDAYPDAELADGVYKIQRAAKEPFKVLCDMDADGGGYTFLKYAVDEAEPKKNAKAAEEACDEWDMDLLITRSPEHLEAAVWVAKSLLLVPVGTGSEKSNIDYLTLLGLYPVVPGLSCVGQALNFNGCPEWKPRHGKWWISDVGMPGLPAKTNCLECSMHFTWMETGELVTYEASSNGGIGAEWRRFICEVSDKLPE
jgi:hypothetical protein